MVIEINDLQRNEKQQPKTNQQLAKLTLLLDTQWWITDEFMHNIEEQGK